MEPEGMDDIEVRAAPAAETSGPALPLLHRIVSPFALRAIYGRMSIDAPEQLEQKNKYMSAVDIVGTVYR